MDNEPEATQRPSERPGGAISEDTGALGPETQPIPSQPPSKPGWVLGGRYLVIDRVGAGGMAEVFRAHDELLARDVAVKVFRTVPVTPDTASGAERQMIELRALAALNHPNLITLFDGSVTGNDGPAFLVMELIDGPSLAARIDDGALPEHEAREVGIQIADALAYVHAQGMVHRDVKPANILLGHDRTVADSTFRARLSDFGIVRLMDSERLTSVNFTLGTASYLAPEQARGSDVGPAADVYSLGLVLIESLTGVRSFAGPPLEAVMARLERSPDIPAHLAPPWPALLAAMTSSDPAARPTAAQVAQTLQDGRSASIPLPVAAGLFPAEAETAGIAAVGGAAALAAAGGAEALSPVETDPWAPADDHPRRRWIAWLLVAGLLAAIAVGGLLLLQPARSSGPRQPLPLTSNHATNAPGTHTRSAAATGESIALSNPTAPSSTHTTQSSRPSSRTPASSPAPSTSAATTSAPPSTSAAPTTTASSTPAPGATAVSTSPAPTATGP